MKVGGKLISIDDIGRSDLDRLIEDSIRPANYQREGVGIRVDSDGKVRVREPKITKPLPVANNDLQANEVAIEAWYIAQEWANDKPLHLSQSELCHGVANSILQMLDKGHGRVPPMTLTPKQDPERTKNNYVTGYHEEGKARYSWGYDKPIEPTQPNAYSSAYAKTYDDWRERPSISARELFD